MSWDAQADLEARAELGVSLDASPDEVRAAYEALARLLKAEGKSIALDRATAAYRILTADAAPAKRRFPQTRIRWAAAGAGVAGLFILGLVASQALWVPAPTPGSGILRPATPAPSTPAPTPSPLNAQILVLSAGDLGPQYSLVRATPALLGPASADASGWDAVFTSATTGTVVESIAVVYPTANDAAESAVAMNGIPPDGTARVVRAIGPVLVIAVVAPGSDKAGDSLAQQVSILEIKRVIAASG